MTSEQAPTPFIITLTKHLPLVEKILLTALAIGTILTVMQIDSTVTRVSLLGLGVDFFLLAYRPTDIPRQEGEQFGFSELLGLMIVPKVLWISSAISATAANKKFMQLRGVVLNLSVCFKCSSVTGDNLQQVGFNIPLRYIFKPS